MRGSCCKWASYCGWGTGPGAALEGAIWAPVPIQCPIGRLGPSFPAVRARMAQLLAQRGNVLTKGIELSPQTSYLLGEIVRLRLLRRWIAIHGLGFGDSGPASV
jgi:hypothetical protein